MDCDDVGVTEANPGIRFAYREFVTPGMLMLVLGISMSLIILYTFVGPLDTRNTLNWNGRLAYCVVTGALCLLICYPAMALTLFLARFRSKAQIGFALAVYSLVMAVPCGAIAYGVYGLFHGIPRPAGELPATYLVCAGNILGATAFVYYVLYLRVSRNQLLAGKAAAASRGDAAPGAHPESLDRTPGAAAHAVAAPEAAIPDRQPRDASPARGASESGMAQAGGGQHCAPDRPAKPPLVSFLDRLPPQLGRDVVYLKVSGHYIEVVTTRGSGVILQRLMDAVRELGSRGMQTHRSYWVAHRHVRYFVRRDRRTLLHLTGDFEVPVSRTYLPEVRRHIKSTPPQTPLRRRATPPPEQQAG